MMITDFTIQIKDLVGQLQEITLITPDAADCDVNCALMAWRNLLKRRDKKLRLISPKLNRGRYSWLPYLEEIEEELPPCRMVVKFGLNENGVKKISYEVKNGQLYFYITTQSGTLSEKAVEIAGEKLKTGLVITLGITCPEQLSDWSTNWPNQLVDNQPIINLDISPKNAQFGTINLIDVDKSALSHLSAEIFRQLHWEIDAETASLLIKGIKAGTNQFSKHISAEVFDTLAFLMRQGGNTNKFEKPIDATNLER